MRQHIGTQIGTHGQTPLSGHTFVQLTPWRTADMSQQRQTPTHTECDIDLHTHAHARRRQRYFCTVHHRAHGGKNIHNTQTHRSTHYTATRHTQRTRTHTRAGNRNGGTVVKSGNIKVNLRSGAAVSQERTRTHAYARIGFYIHCPVFLCVLFPCASLCRFMTFSDVVLPCLLTLWACRGGVWICVFPLFMLFVSIFIYVLSRFQ